MLLNKINTILLVEDDPITSFIQSKVIKDMGYQGEIVEALHAKAALEYLQESYTLDASATEPAGSLLILLDIKLPFMDGFEFLEALEQLEGLDRENMHIAILSTSLLKKDTDRATRFNLAGYLVKPLTESKLNALVESITLA